MKWLEALIQRLATLHYVIAFGVLLVPCLLLNVTWHAALDIWTICEGELRTSKDIG